MNASVKNSHTLRNGILAAAGISLLGLWLIRSSLPPAHLPTLSQLTRHDTLQAQPTVSAVPTASTSATVTPSRLEIVANQAPAIETLPVNPATPAPASVTDGDRAFFEKAGQAGIQQDKLSRGVLNQLVYPEVREYAYALMDEQTAINAELLLLAARKQVVVPMPERIAFRRWTRAEGSVDQHYVNTLLETDTEIVALYEKAAQSGDADIASFARKTLPVVQRHLTAVKALKKITE